ncbi:RNA-directed DNA polymerase, eukaryota [Tanacetum coccineum]
MGDNDWHKVTRKKHRSVFQRLDFRGVRGSFPQRSKEDQGTHISKSVFVTNFPENFESNDLWKICEGYGNVVDVYIPNRKSKAGKRFAFVRFIKVGDMDRLIGNLCTIWIGRFHLHANVVRYERPRIPCPTVGYGFVNNHAPSGSNHLIILVSSHAKTLFECMNGHAIPSPTEGYGLVINNHLSWFIASESAKIIFPTARTLCISTVPRCRAGFVMDDSCLDDRDLGSLQLMVRINLSRAFGVMNLINDDLSEIAILREIPAEFYRPRETFSKIDAKMEALDLKRDLRFVFCSKKNIIKTQAGRYILEGLGERFKRKGVRIAIWRYLQRSIGSDVLATKEALLYILLIQFRRATILFDSYPSYAIPSYWVNNSHCQMVQLSLIQPFKPIHLGFGLEESNIAVRVMCKTNIKTYASHLLAREVRGPKSVKANIKPEVDTNEEINILRCGGTNFDHVASITCPQLDSFYVNEYAVSNFKMWWSGLMVESISMFRRMLDRIRAMACSASSVPLVDGEGSFLFPAIDFSMDFCCTISAGGGVVICCFEDLPCITALHSGTKLCASGLTHLNAYLSPSLIFLAGDVGSSGNVECMKNEFGLHGSVVVGIGSQWGEVMELEDGNEDLFARKRLCIKTKHANNILDSFKIIVKGKVFQIRAKELFVWSPSFKEVPEVVHCSDDESVKNEADINVVDNTVTSKENGVIEASKDPFNIYDLLNRHKKEVGNSGMGKHKKFSSGWERMYSFSYNSDRGSSRVFEEVVKSVIKFQLDGRVLWDTKGGGDFIASLINQWNGEECMVLGDFNEVRCKEDRWGSTFLAQGACSFNSFISNAGLNEVQLEGYSFTWAHPSASKMSKLDRFLVTDGFLSLFPHISAVCLDRHLSDHRPILLREMLVDFGATPFRLYHSWLSIPGFDQMITSTWNSFILVDSNGMIRFKKKL